MNNHRIRFIGLDQDWQAKCSCRARSTFGSQSDCEVWKWQHLQEIQRVRAALARTPSLRLLTAYYREQAADTTNSLHERDLWQRLADELETRVGQPSDEDQMELW